MKGFSWSLVQTWGGKGIGVLVFVVLSRLVAPSDLGLLAMGIAVTAVGSTLLTAGPVQVIVQRTEVPRELLNTLFWTQAGIAAVLMGSLAGVAGPLERLVHTPGLAHMLHWLALAAFLQSLAAVPEGLVRRQLGFRALAMRGLATATMSGAAAIALAVRGHPVAALIVQAMVQAVATTTLTWAAARWSPGLRCSREGLRSAAGFSLATGAATLIWTLNLRGDDFLVGVILGSASLGYYSVAYRLVYLVTDATVASVTNVALANVSATLRAGGRAITVYRRGLQFSVGFSLPAFCLLGVCAPSLVRLGFGPQWQPAVAPMQVLCVLGAVTAFSLLDGPVFSALGRPSGTTLVQLTRSVGSAVLLLSIGRTGVTAAAAAVVLGELVSWPLRFVLLRRIAGITPLQALSPVRIPVLGAAALLAGVLPVVALVGPLVSGWQLVALVVVLGAAIYLGTVNALTGGALSAAASRLGGRRRGALPPQAWTA